MKPGRYFLYFDPLHQLSTTTQRRWSDPTEQARMIEDALAKAKAHAR